MTTALEIAQQRAAEVEARVRHAREKLPICSAALDMFREIFGKECQLVWAEEGNVRFRERGPAGVQISDVGPPPTEPEKPQRRKVAEKAIAAMRQEALIA